MMRQTRPIALCVLVVFYCSFTKGDHHGSSVPPPPPGSTPLATSSSPQSSSTTQPESVLNSTDVHLNTSSGTDGIFVPLNGSLSQITRDGRNITNTTHAPGQNSSITNTTHAPGQNSSITNTTHAPAAARTTGDSSSVPPNNTESKGSSPLPTIEMVRTTFPTTQAAGGLTQTSSSPPPTTTQPKGTTAGTTTGTTAGTTTSRDTSSSSTNKFHVSTPMQARANVETPSELNVGDDKSSTSLDPLLASLVSVFVVTTAIISLLIFLKFRHRNERPEFRRLQDLPMDDMMEDTPLSMYSY